MGRTPAKKAHVASQPTGAPDSTAARIIDIVVVLLLVPLVVPLALVIAAAIVIDSPGPVLWRVPRLGRHGRALPMLKFRSMVSEAAGPPLRTDDDPRQTPVGHLLSRTRLNELPQLWHVLAGDMRLVGPRPQAPEFVDEQPRAYAEILTVPPGLTGATQLAFSDESRMLASVAPDERRRAYVELLLPGKVEMDLAYVRGRSTLGDLRILARTVTLPRLRMHRSSERRMLAWHEVALSGGALLFAVLYAAAIGS